MRTTRETTTTGVLAVLANTTVAGGDVTAVLAGLGQVGRHREFSVEDICSARCQGML